MIEGINARVLIINDDEIKRNKLEESLTQKGYSVDISETHEAFQKIANALYNQTPYHTVIYGSTIHPLGGVDLVSKLRKTKVDGQTPFIFMLDNLDAKVYSEMCGVTPHAIIPVYDSEKYFVKKVDSAVEKGQKLYSNYSNFEKKI